MSTGSVTITLPTFDALPTPGGDTRGCRLCQVEMKTDTGLGGGADQVVLSVSQGTVHAACYADYLAEQSAAVAWLIIAEEIARRPRAYTAAEIRAALTAVGRIATARIARRPVTA